MSRSATSLRRTATAGAIALASTAALVQTAAPSSAVVPGERTLLSIGPGGEQFTGHAFLSDVNRDGTVTLISGQTTSSSSNIFTALFVREGAVTTEVPGSLSPAAAGMSDTGRYIVFTRLFGGDIYRYDRDTATAMLIVPATNDNCGRMDVSDDGKTVAFSTVAGLAPEDLNGACDAYVWQQDGGVNWLRSASATPNSASSTFAALTPNGRFALFTSTDRTVVTGDTTERQSALFLRDLTTGVTTLESRDNAGAPLVQGGAAGAADLTDDASRIAFHSYSDPTGEYQYWSMVYLRDRATGQSRRLVSSINGGPVLTNFPTIDGAGRFVALEVDWGQVQARPQSQYSQVGIVNLTDNSIQLSSHRHGDPLADGNNQSQHPRISADGTTASFSSYATDLIDPPPSGFLSRVFSYGIAGGANPDQDADGILDVVDADRGAGTSPGAFADAYVSGRIISVASGMTVQVTDAPDPLDGVRIQVNGAAGTVARISACGLTTSFRAGTDAVLTCGSVIARVAFGVVSVDIPGGLATVNIPAGAAARVGTETSGEAFVNVLNAGAAGNPVTLTVDGTTVPLSAGTTTFNPVRFTGFSAPVDNGTTINKVKAGRAVPLKWRLTDISGAPVTTLASATVRFVAGACNAGSGPVDDIEQTTAGASSLQNLGNGYYAMNWKTPTTTTPCGELRLDIRDGVLHKALFQLS